MRSYNLNTTSTRRLTSVFYVTRNFRAHRKKKIEKFDAKLNPHDVLHKRLAQLWNPMLSLHITHPTSINGFITYSITHIAYIYITKRET